MFQHEPSKTSKANSLSLPALAVMYETSKAVSGDLCDGRNSNDLAIRAVSVIDIAVYVYLSIFAEAIWLSCAHAGVLSAS